MNILNMFVSRFNARDPRELNDSEKAPQSLDKMDSGLGNGASLWLRFAGSRYQSV
jgi:hypothetical protein